MDGDIRVATGLSLASQLACGFGVAAPAAPARAAAPVAAFPATDRIVLQERA